MVGNWLNPGDGIARDAVSAAGAILGVWLLLRWSWRGPSLKVLARSFASLREQRFIHLLRAEAFADPPGVVMTLSGNNAAWYLNRPTAEAFAAAVRGKLRKPLPAWGRRAAVVA